MVTTIATETDLAWQPVINKAYSAGSPKSQMRNFIAAKYVPLPKLLSFHAACRECDKDGGPDEILLAGTRGAAKTHTAFAQVAIDDCQRVPGIKVLFLRKVMKSAGESLDDLVYKILFSTSHEYSQGQVRFPNGSRILVGGYNIPSDIDKYLGVEYDIIVIEEATQLTEDKRQKIGMSLRTTKPGWRERMYMTTNADGVGVTWCKRDFVFPWRQGKIEQLHRRYFEAYHQDNPWLTDSYRRRIESLRGSLHRAWAKLDWDAFEGMAFPMWDYNIHVIDPIEIPDRWLRWRAVDWGSNAPFCCGWFAKDPDSGRIIVYREAYEAGLTDDQQAERVKDMTLPGEHIAYTFADPASYWEKKSSEAGFYTAADVYQRHGVPLTRANNERIPGKRKVDRALSLMPDGRPGLLVFSTCVNLIDQLSNLVYDDVHIEDVDTSLEDHAYDMLRYGLTNYNPIVEPNKDEEQKQQRRNWEKMRKIL